MTHAIETVEAFIARWGKSVDDFRSAIRDWFTPETVWDNVGIARTTGIDEALAFFERFAAQAGFVSFDVEMINIAAAGNVVLTERVDRAVLPDGSVRGGPGLRVMGAFEVDGPKIVAWRDYLDTAPFQRKPAAG